MVIPEIGPLLEPRDDELALGGEAHALLLSLAEPLLGSVAERTTPGLPLVLVQQLSCGPVLVVGTWKRTLPNKKLIANAAANGRAMKALGSDHLLATQWVEHDDGTSCILYALASDSVVIVRGYGHYAVGPTACHRFWQFDGSELRRISDPESALASPAKEKDGEYGPQ